MKSSPLLRSRSFRTLVAGLAALLFAFLVAMMPTPAGAAGVTDTILGDPADAMAINTGDTPNSTSGTPLNLNVINASEPSIRSGRYDDTTNAEFGSNTSAVFVFQLPDLGAMADPFVSATFTFNLEADVASGFTHSLYGLDARASSTVLAEDFQFDGTDGTTAETLLQGNILVGGGTPSLAGTYTSDNISNWLNLQYNGGAGAGQYVFLRINAPGGNPAMFNGTTNGALITSADAASNQPVIDYVARRPDFTWDGGGGNGDWSTSANWVGDVAPAPPAGLAFAGTTDTSTTNDLAPGTEFYGIDFPNTGAGESFSLGGNAIALCHDISTSTATGSITDTITLDIELTGGGRFIDLGTDHDLDITGVISGSQRLLKVGDGTLTLSEANTHPNISIGDLFVGPTAGGTLVITHEQALGTGQMRFEQGGTLVLGANGMTITNDIFVPNWGGSIRTIRLDLDGTNTGTLTGNFDVRWTLANGFVLDVGADDTLTMTGTISTGAGGGAGITKDGDGTLVISGINNSYRGNTTVNAGTLSLGDGSLDILLNDAFDVIVATGATLELNYSGTDVIDELFLGGVQLTAGIYDATTHPGILTGTGSLTVSNPPATVPEIIDISIDGSGNVILTLDGSEAGLTAQQSSDLADGSFVDVASTPGTNTLTIPAGSVDPNTDGADFYRVRN